MKRKVEADRVWPMDGVPAHIARLYRAVINYLEKSGAEVTGVGGVAHVAAKTPKGEMGYNLTISYSGTEPTFAQVKAAKGARK